MEEVQEKEENIVESVGVTGVILRACEEVSEAGEGSSKRNERVS